MSHHAVLIPPATNAYERDFVAWAIAQARLLRERRFGAIDFDHVAEELEDLARSDEREAVNRLKRIVEHLLKLMVSADRDPRGKWRSSIVNQRDDLDVVFSRSPSLSARRDELFLEAWSRGLGLARAELRGETAALAQLQRMDAGLPSFSVAQALDPDFFPGD